MRSQEYRHNNTRAIVVLYWYAAVLSLIAIAPVFAQGLIVNEFSNGESGSEEFWELVVVGSASNPSGNVDLTDWILDDNDGSFPSSGVAPGYFQITGNCFSNVAPGSIILVYNAADPRGDAVDTPLPADDPTDSNGDGVYVVASDATRDGLAATASNACLMSCSVNTFSCPAANITYGPSSTMTIGMRNGGDAPMTRNPSNAFFHGFSYGDLGAGPTFNAGTGSGTDQEYYFTCGDYNTNLGSDSNPVYIKNSVLSAPLETPGVANDDANASFLALINAGAYDYTDLASNCNATTPVTLSYFKVTDNVSNKKVTDNTKKNLRFEWSTATETSNLGFNLYAEIDGQLQLLNEDLIPSKVVDTVTPQHYQFSLVGIEAKTFWLVDIDTQGKTTQHGPYQLNQEHGRPTAINHTIAWQAIATEHQSKRVDRKNFQLRTRARAINPLTRTEEHNIGQLKLLVDIQGVYRVSYEQLLAADYDLSGVNGRDIALLNHGESVPIRVNTTISGRRFGPGSFIEFIGEPLDSMYSKHNVYLLTINRSMVKRIHFNRARSRRHDVPQPYYMATSKIARQRKYSFASPNGDPWFDDALLASSNPLSRNYAINIDHYVTGKAASTLTVNLWGVTNFINTQPDHHVAVEFNGIEAADQHFDGLVDRTFNSILANNTLREGTNILTIRLPHDTGAPYDLIHLEGFDIHYPRAFVANKGRLSFTAAGAVFEITGLPDEQVRVFRQHNSGVIEQLLAVDIHSVANTFTARFAGTATPATYFVTTESALLSASLEPVLATPVTVGSANYRMIAHADFIGADLNRLVAAREADGYSVEVIDVAAIYATYSDYITDPQAIRDYLYDAYTEGAEYVLLVGGDTYDYHDNLGQNAMSFIPSLYAQTDELIRYAPVDALYTDVDGDNVPDMAIGRFPVRNSAELAVMVDQTLAYSNRNYGRTAVFAADAFDQINGYNFTNDSNNIIARLPFDWQVERAYIDDLGVADARATLLENINQGVSLTAFFGHSGPTVWTFDGLLNSSDLGQLTNSDKPTVVTQWGCWNTYFVSPTADTLGHQFLLSGNRGAAAVLGASTLTEAAAEAELAEFLFDELLQPGITLGEAIRIAKQNYAVGKPHQLDVILGWTLLGDPTLVIER